jgi:hypothetical protein
MKLKMTQITATVFLGASIIGVGTTGCVWHQPPPPPPHVYTSWADDMKDLADQMNKAWKMSNYIVVPLISGAQWPIGTTFANNGGQFGPPDFPCGFLSNSAVTVPMADLPSFTSTNSFTFAAGTPSALSSVITANAGISTLEFSSLTFTNLSQEAVGETDLQQALGTNSACHGSMANAPIAIIRGYISGSLNIQSTDSNVEKLNISAVKYGVFGITNNGGGSLLLQQTVPTRWFAIISRESAIAATMTGGNPADQFHTENAETSSIPPSTERTNTGESVNIPHFKTSRPSFEEKTNLISIFSKSP